MITSASLCTGYAGLDMAAEEVFDAQLVWYAEADRFAAMLLAERLPNVPNFGDITTLDWATMEPVDILTAGYPCQPFSTAGDRKGTDDERHLWPFIADAIRVLRPGRVVLENVDAHLSLGFDVVLGDLAALGFDAEWIVVRASDVGACHRRARIFVVATNTDRAARRWPRHAKFGDGPATHGGRGTSQPEGRGRAATDPDCEHSTGSRVRGGRDEAERIEAGSVPGLGGEAQAVADTGRGEPERRRGPGAVDGSPRAARDEVRGPDTGGDAVVGRGAAHAAADSQGPEGLGHAEPGRWPVAGAVGEGTSDADGWGLPWFPELDGDEISDAADWSARGGHADRRGDEDQWGDYGPAIRRHERALGRPAPSPVDDRGRLSPVFVEWMMMLPEGWVTDYLMDVSTPRAVAADPRPLVAPFLSRAQVLKLLGNGVLPPQAAHSLRILEARAAA